MTTPLLPGKPGTITFQSSTAPSSVAITAVPGGSMIVVGTVLSRADDGTTATFTTPGNLDKSGLYLLGLSYPAGVQAGSMECATRLQKRVGGSSNSAILTVWVYGGVVVPVTDAFGVTPMLSSFSSPNGALYASTNGVKVMMSQLAGRSPGMLGAALSDLTLAMTAAAGSHSPVGATIPEAVSLLVGSGWTLA